VLSLLVISPAFQRRGIGKLLTQDGIDRAHANGCPVFVIASPPGALLYHRLGFELKEAPEITDNKIVQRIMVKESHSY
jgi:predicted N-acetyltransferase YhbS